MTPKILLIEDDATYAQALQSELEQAGMRVAVTTDGKQAFIKIKKKPPDLIVLDNNLPETTGFMVLQKLKIDKQTKFIPVIVLTNFGGEANRERALDLGAEEFITKASMTLKELVALVRRHLP